ncbi:MAG: hypothetical protein BMS9Abin05_0207 [Rhodothermia bacterium]|nr:MAG: hypothetical protein BMS9Abin05_0207 [Rhodothermia bacterium]
MSISEHLDEGWWDDSVEAFVDGDLSAEEASRFKSLMELDVAVATEVKMAKAIQHSFRNLDSVECPDPVSDAILKRARADLIANARVNAWHAVRTFFKPLLRPLLAMTILLAIVLSSVWSGRTTTKIDPAVAEALDDVKWTLAYVSQVTRQTAIAVRAEALEPLVLEQMKDAVETFIDN